MHVLVEQLLRQFVEVLDFRHGHDGKAPEMGIDDEGLGIGVANHADAGGAALETAERRLEFSAEIRVLSVVNGTREGFFFFVVACHAASAGAEVRVVVGAVEEVSSAVFA